MLSDGITKPFLPVNYYSGSYGPLWETIVDCLLKGLNHKGDKGLGCRNGLSKQKGKNEKRGDIIYAHAPMMSLRMDSIV